MPIRISRRGAFTLLELLVVIAILALLAALLLPSLSKARSSVRKSVCMSNLRQIGIAIQTYAEDHHGSMPGDPPRRMGQSTCFIRWRGKPQGLGRLLPRYCASAEVLFCPVDPSPEVGLAAWKNGRPMVESHFMYRATDAGASACLSDNARRVIAMAKMRLDTTSGTFPGHDNGIPALWGDGSVGFLKATFKQVNFNPIYIDTPFIWADTQR